MRSPTFAVRRRLVPAAAALCLAAAGVLAVPAVPGSAQPSSAKAPVRLWLTIGHNNDGESQLIDAGTGFEDYGGVARLATVVGSLETEALARPRGGFILLNSGDNYLAGPEFNESLQKEGPFYDTMALDAIGFDAMAIGNHEFDFGPDVFARFVRGFEDPVTFVSSNLDVSGEPKLDRLANKGRIAQRAIIEEGDVLIGIVGATTPELPFISSPRNVQAKLDVAKAVNRQVTKLENAGVQIIVMISQLQSIEEDIALAPLLHGVDVMVAGGGNELLADPDQGDLLIPGDETNVYGTYPMYSTNADGAEVPIVTTSGDYRYLGALTVGFDADGDLIRVNDEASRPIRVTSTVNPDGVEPDPFIQENVVDPLVAALDEAANNIVAVSEVDLNGVRSPGIRTQETNEGNLIADSLLDAATDLAPAFGAPLPDIAIQNGGGIRNNSVIPAGDISELTVFSMVPFANFVAVVPDIPPDQLKEILENAVSRVELVDGRFPQIAGFELVYDAAGTAQVIDENGVITTPGTRVVDVTLTDGTPIIAGGAIVDGAPSVNIATIDFLARGGDQYPFAGAPFTTLGTTYFQALYDYLVENLAGAITATDYPEGGEGRITRLN